MLIAEKVHVHALKVACRSFLHLTNGQSRKFLQSVLFSSPAVQLVCRRHASHRASDRTGDRDVKLVEFSPWSQASDATSTVTTSGTMRLDQTTDGGG